MARTTDDSPGARGSAWILYLLLLIFGVVILWRSWPSTPDLGNDSTAKPRGVTPAGATTSDEQRRIDVFSRAKVSVVNVSSAQIVRNHFSMNVQQVPKGTGTGIMWDQKGRVVTNYHVVEGANNVRVTLDDHTTWNVYQIKYDPVHDLAVLWTDIPESKRKPIPLGESSKLQVGQTALAIGNPFGLDHSLSAGIVSALGRDMKNDDGHVLRGLIQTDAAINPGNSGGPLLDSSGRLIGVDTAIISPSGASAGIGFAIPVDIVNRVVPRLISGTKEARPGLGIVEAPDQWAKRRGIDGVLVIDVIADGPAEKAGLHATRRDEDGQIVWGDVIVGIDEHKVHSAADLYAVLADHYKVGQQVTVHILRDGEPQDVEMTLTADQR